MARSSPMILVDEVLLLIPKSLLWCPPPPDPCRLVVFLHHSLITGAGLHVSGSDASGPLLHAVLAPLERVYENPAGFPPAKGFQRWWSGRGPSKEMLPFRPEL